MLETIISWIATALSQVFSVLLTTFLNMLQVDLSTLAAFFPPLVTGYRMFQTVGIGLVAAIAVWQMFKFFGGQLSEVRDTPVRILIRSCIAAWLIWFGGYFVDMFVHIAQLPYEAMASATGETASGLVKPLDYSEFNVAKFFPDAAAVALGPSAVILIYLFILMAIVWNLLKLVIEVLERYLMVGVLAFSAPLIYPTVSSQSTTHIFKKWLGMFFGQLALLTLSAWMLRVIISGFDVSSAEDGTAIFQIILTLAMCKIAQRIDSYMQTLGIGVGTTGGSILDDVLAAGAMVGGKLRSSGGGGKTVLGADGRGRLQTTTGLLGAGVAATAGIKERLGETAGMSKTQALKHAVLDNKDALKKEALDGFGATKDSGYAFATGRTGREIAQNIRNNAPDEEGFEFAGLTTAAAEGEAEKQKDDQEALRYVGDQYGEDKMFGKNKVRGDSVITQKGQEKGVQWDNDYKERRDGTANAFEGTRAGVGAALTSGLTVKDVKENAQDLQAGMVSTAKEASADVAEDVLTQAHREPSADGTPNVLDGNDEVMAPLVPKAFDMKDVLGEEEAASFSEDRISNVQALSGNNHSPDAKSVSFDYEHADGSTARYEVFNDNAAYEKNEAGAIVKREGYDTNMPKVQSKGSSNNSYHVKKTNIPRQKGDAFKKAETRVDMSAAQRQTAPRQTPTQHINHVQQPKSKSTPSKGQFKQPKQPRQQGGQGPVKRQAPPRGPKPPQNPGGMNPPTK